MTLNWMISPCVINWSLRLCNWLFWFCSLLCWCSSWLCWFCNWLFWSWDLISWLCSFISSSLSFSFKSSTSFELSLALDSMTTTSAAIKRKKIISKLGLGTVFPRIVKRFPYLDLQKNLINFSDMHISFSTQMMKILPRGDHPYIFFYIRERYFTNLKFHFFLLLSAESILSLAPNPIQKVHLCLMWKQVISDFWNLPAPFGQKLQNLKLSELTQNVWVYQLFHL